MSHQELHRTRYFATLKADMDDHQELPKAYDSTLVEDGIYAAWLKSGYFTPENLPDLAARTEPFCIVLPPPNVTGTLHMGHAVMLAIEDAMVRIARLQGKRALWIPGTDHAAIATQSKVEKIIQKEEGKSRHDLGRDELMKRVEAFAQESHDTIVNQVKKMGASVDWSREAYTLDAARNLAVRTAFKRLYDLGLLYRGFRVVNWDPIGQTTIADDEVVYKPSKAKLYTFKYSADFPIAISTTRPETKVGDTAVAVHPTDKRYKKLIGKSFEVEFAGAKLTIKIVGDDSVDPEFGTGALGVTPAHSMIDSEIAKRHELPMIAVIGEDARMTAVAGELVSGKTTIEARELVVSWLREHNLLDSEVEVEQNISTAERTGGIVEPLPKLQWFIDVNKEFNAPSGKSATLKELMSQAVRSKEVNVIPEKFEKTYFSWVDNLRDWCISRQIWFGHRIPVWYRPVMASAAKPSLEEIALSPTAPRNDIETFVGIEAPEGEGWTQDEDTLDTWFSAGLWTFSTLGWPDENAADLKMYHPTTMLETGYDIIFFWVARMILMSTALLGEVPFKNVYLHGLVRDEQGRKMSKSLDNIIDPLDMIKQYGADATRLSLVIGSTPGNDMKLSVEKVAGFRNFTNKLWNISRFILSSASPDPSTTGGVAPSPQTLADRWILGRLGETIEKCTAHADKFEYSLYGEVLREFTWNEFADWYLEIAKIQKKDSVESTNRALLYVLERLLILWHPFMPFVTEEIYKQFNSGLIMVAKWPEAEFKLSAADRDLFETLRTTVVDIRNLRATYRIEPKVKTDATILIGGLEEQAEIIKTLARVAELKFATKAEGKVVSTVNAAVHLPADFDLDAERARIDAELADLKAYSASLEVKLGNKEFTGKAPVKIVDEMKAKLADATQKISALQTQRKSL